MPRKNSLADPVQLRTLAKKDNLLQVVIETPRLSRNKFAFDPDQHIFALKAVLPAGMAFPYDFGFLPRTIAGDGDPIDVLVLMDEPAFPGVLVPSRLIGVIEGEIGDIGTGSQIHDTIPDLSKGLTSPKEAKNYVDATGVDILAPAVGNMHGMVTSMIEGKDKKRLDLKRISEIKDATGSLITLHGASGTNDDDLRKSIAAGINIIHMNTELRVAWRQSLDRVLSEHKQEVVPYKLLPPVVDAVRQVALSRLKLFNNL